MKVSDFLNHNFYFILFPELGGGHHLQNLISLDRSFFPLRTANHDELYQSLKVWYEDPTSVNAHALPFKGTTSNATFNKDLFFEYLDDINYSYKNSTHISHAAQLYMHDFQFLHNRSAIILTIKDRISQDIINERARIKYNQQLMARCSTGAIEYTGHTLEKFIYSREASMTHLGFEDHRVFEIEVRDFFNPNVEPVIRDINRFFNLDIPIDQAQHLHSHWLKISWR